MTCNPPHHAAAAQPGPSAAAPPSSAAPPRAPAPSSRTNQKAFEFDPRSSAEAPAAPPAQHKRYTPAFVALHQRLQPQREEHESRVACAASSRCSPAQRSRSPPGSGRRTASSRSTCTRCYKNAAGEGVRRIVTRLSVMRCSSSSTSCACSTRVKYGGRVASGRDVDVEQHKPPSPPPPAS